MKVDLEVHIGGSDSWFFLRQKCRVRVDFAGGVYSHTGQHSRHRAKEISLGSSSEGFPTHRWVEHHRCAFGFGLSKFSAGSLKLKLEQHKNSVVTEWGEIYLHVTLSLLSFSCIHTSSVTQLLNCFNGSQNCWNCWESRTPNLCSRNICKSELVTDFWSCPIWFF